MQNFLNIFTQEKNWTQQPMSLITESLWWNTKPVNELVINKNRLRNKNYLCAVFVIITANPTPSRNNKQSHVTARQGSSNVTHMVVTADGAAVALSWFFSRIKRKYLERWKRVRGNNGIEFFVQLLQLLITLDQSYSCSSKQNFASSIVQPMGFLNYT